MEFLHPCSIHEKRAVEEEGGEAYLGHLYTTSLEAKRIKVVCDRFLQPVFAPVNVKVILF